jgi:hypothetical protein
LVRHPIMETPLPILENGLPQSNTIDQLFHVEGVIEIHCVAQ